MPIRSLVTVFLEHPTIRLEASDAPALGEKLDDECPFLYR